MDGSLSSRVVVTSPKGAEQRADRTEAGLAEERDRNEALDGLDDEVRERREGKR